MNELAPQPTRLRVLIVDDEPELAEIAAEFLKRAGMEVILAPTDHTRRASTSC